MRVLELGNYVVPAYAGMVLTEQGHQVVKWTNYKDPLFDNRQGDELWAWLNAGKTVLARDARELTGEWDVVLPGWKPDVVLENFRASTLASWGIDPVEMADRYGVRWVAMRDELGGRSFDLIAQARSWLEYAPWVPFWVGDTCAGLWMAFKAMASSEPGYFQLGQASCMQKLVEGELILERPDTPGRVPWETEPYHVDDSEAIVQYKGQTQREPIRSREWKLAHLWHESGRIRI